MVYGGGSIGLMGEVADAALANGAEVIGVITDDLRARELGHHGVTRLEVVPDMHIRKRRMSDLADAFVVLPGGIGTLEEFFEVWTWQQLGIHDKPVGVLSPNGFWHPLEELVAALTGAGFVEPEFSAGLVVAEQCDQLFVELENWQVPAGRRLG